MAKPKAAEEERTPDPDVGRPEEGGAPLFPTASHDWIAVQVERIDPAEEEGFLGRLPITATEQEIRGRWGGGRYLVRAVNAKNQFKQNRTLAIAGDPVFISEVNEERWRRGLGQRRGGQVVPPAAAAAAPPAFGPAELLTVLQSMQQMNQAQQQQWLQQQAAERAAADDRRRAEDERRRQDDREREERRAREMDEQRARDREFMQTTIQLITAKPAGGEQGHMQAFITGLTTALKLRPGGGGDGSGGDEDEDGEGARSEDPIAETIRGAVRGLADAIAGRAGGGAAPAAAPATSSSGEDVTVTGPLAEKLKSFVNKSKASGVNPETLLASGMDVLETKLPPPRAPAPPAATIVRPSNGAAAATVARAVEAVRRQQAAPVAKE